VAHVDQAMSHVDEVAQRNASGAEQLSATAAEMASQATALRDLVASVQLDRTALMERRPSSAAE
jgi:methyl-accepting chemotaxis protein